MAYDIGVNVVEVDGLGAPSITGAAVSVAAFNVTTRRGVPNQPQRVTSFTQFTDRFGSYFPGMYGAYLVKGFFDNGGRVAYVNRVTGAGAGVASHTFKDDDDHAALTLTGGFRGVEDPGAWARDLAVKVTSSSSARSRLAEAAAATITGADLPAATDISTAVSLALEVDGTALTLAFPPVGGAAFADLSKATREELRDAINGQTHLLTANVEGKTLVLTSTGEEARLNDQPSSLKVTSAALGFTPGDPAIGTPASLSGTGTTLAHAGTFTPGDALVISAGKKSARAKLLTVDARTGALTWTPDIGDGFDAAAVTVANAEFDLELRTPPFDDQHVVETHTGLSLEPDVDNFAPALLNHPLTGSRFVCAKAISTRRPKATDDFLALEGGSDPQPTAGDFSAAFPNFDVFDVQLVTCERSDLTITKAGIDYCEGREDAMYVGAAPVNTVGNGEAALAYSEPLKGKKRYGALYGPWIVVPDPIGLGDAPRALIPPVGHVLGVYARIETTRGIWKAPAGDEADLRGVLDVETRLSDRDHTHLVVDGAINGIRAIPGSGIVVDASRTLSSDPRWRYVNVRLLFNFVKSSLKAGLRGARQEPNRDTLWRTIKFGTITPFLMGLWRQGAFGTGGPEDTFTVIVDETNNPPDQVQQGMLTVEVYFYPSNPAETIVIIVGQQPGGGTASEA